MKCFLTFIKQATSFFLDVASFAEHVSFEVSRLNDLVMFIFLCVNTFQQRFELSKRRAWF